MTGRVQEQLPELLALAHDRSESARLQLAGKLTNLFLAEDVSLTPREEVMVNELIDQLLKTNSHAVRHELVTKFAAATRMPRKMAMSLACESIDVARAILLNNETLTDEDLITLVETQSRDHACAVASRESVSEAVADALVTTGDIRVMQIVAENMGAKLSHRCLSLLTEAARLAENIQRPLLSRPELPPESVLRLYWWVAQDLRRATLERFGFTSGQIDMALAKAIEEKLNEHLLDRHDDREMIRVAAWLEERGTFTPQLLLQLLRLGHFRLFNIAMSRLANLDLLLIDAIVDAPGGRTLAALCRSIDIDKANFVSIFLLSRGARPDDQIVHPRELSEALEAYDRLNHALAQSMLYSWRENPAYLLVPNGEQITAG